MERNFVYFTISIFDDCDFNSFSEIVYQIKKEAIETKKIGIYTKLYDFKEYLNPPSGGHHFPAFSFWKNQKYPNKVFFISNYEDGLFTLCNIIHKQLCGNLIMCSMSNESCVSNPAYRFYFSDSTFSERNILVIKDEKWIFYESGTPLSIENTNYYKKRLIKNRLNNAIIEEYLFNLGIDLWNICSSIDASKTYIQKEW